MAAETFPNRPFFSKETDKRIKWAEVFNSHVTLVQDWGDCSLQLGYCRELAEGPEVSFKGKTKYHNMIYISILFWGLTVHWN